MASDKKYTPAIADLYPNCTPEELIEVDAVIEQYLVQTLRQHDRICREADEGDPKAIKVLKLLRSLARARTKLSEKEFGIFEVVANFQHDHDRWPSARELMKILGYKSPRSTARWIKLFEVTKIMIT